MPLAISRGSDYISIPAVAENQPVTNQNRMTSEFSNFAARLRETFSTEGQVIRVPELSSEKKIRDSHSSSLQNDKAFNSFALELFALQFSHNAPYRKFCEARGSSPQNVKHWSDIPAIPTSAFKEFELSCLPPGHRTKVFHSSGTTEHKPSRHFHNDESLAIY